MKGYTGPHRANPGHTVIQDPTGQYRTMWDNTKPNGKQTCKILGHYVPDGSIWEHMRPYGTIRGHTGPYRPYRTMQDHAGPCGIMRDDT